jgi:hypothetical protein
MINPRYVTRHGKTILVETLETPGMRAPKAKKVKQQEAFAKVPLEWAAETAKCTETSSALVWILMLYMAWELKSLTFPLSNVMLAKYKVSRKMKYHVLTLLEDAGRIRVERNGKRSPVVTLLVAPKLEIA